MLTPTNGGGQFRQPGKPRPNLLPERLTFHQYHAVTPNGLNRFDKFRTTKPSFASPF
jgi:hypothetical protein